MVSQNSTPSCHHIFAALKRKLGGHKFRDCRGVYNRLGQDKRHTANWQLSTVKGTVGTTMGTAVMKTEVLQLKLKIQNPKYVQR